MATSQGPLTARRSRRHKEGFCLRVLRGDGPPGPGENAALLFEATAFVGFAMAAPGNEGRCVRGHCWVRGRLRHAYEDLSCKYGNAVALSYARDGRSLGA